MLITTAVLGVGLVASTVILGAAVLILRHDYSTHQAEMATRQAATPHAITCADFRHVRLRVHGHTARCASR